MAKSKLYQQAVEWIAVNDETACLDAAEMETLISVVMIADLFTHTALYVANDVIRIRKEQRHRQRPIPQADLITEYGITQRLSRSVKVF